MNDNNEEVAERIALGIILIFWIVVIISVAYGLIAFLGWYILVFPVALSIFYIIGSMAANETFDIVSIIKKDIQEFKDCLPEKKDEK